MSALSQAVAAARETYAFQRDQHHAWRRAAGMLLLTNLLTAAGFAGYVWLHSTVYVTVAATPDGRVVELQPLDEPVMTDTALKQWTLGAVTEALTLGHHDWRMRLAAARAHFSDEGYESFVASLEESGFLQRLRDNRQVASAVARGAPVITETLVHGERRGFQLEVPLLVTFEAGRRRTDQKLVARVLVLRQPYEERPAGIAIEQLIATRAVGGG